MYKNISQSVQYFEHPSVNTFRQLNWEDVKVFLSLARHASFRKSADSLGLSTNTVRNHIERLEHQTGTLMFARHARGVVLTREGRSLLESAQKMELAAADVHRLARRSPLDESGRVRIVITEGLGTFWLVPRLVRFQRSHPNIVLETNCTFREPDVSKMETDISIQLTRPAHAELKVVKLGRMHVMPFASPEYLRTFGTPKTTKDIESHKIVEQLSPQLDISAVDRLFPGKPREGFVSIVTNTSTAHFWAVVRGAGLGMLPTYVAGLGANVVPIDIGLRLSHEIWLSYHPDARRHRHVDLTLDRIKEDFDHNRFPWFADEFVHPNEVVLLDPKAIEENHFLGLLATQ